MTTWLEHLRENLRTQDNRLTAWPVFCVQQKRRLYGMDPEYAFDESGIVWVFDGEEVDEEERCKLEANYDATGEEPDGYTRTGFQDIWEFVTCCFTEQGAKDYLECNGHNLKGPRIFVESAYRNEEWQRVAKLLSQRCDECRHSDSPYGHALLCRAPRAGESWMRIDSDDGHEVVVRPDGGSGCDSFEPKGKP